MPVKQIQSLVQFSQGNALVWNSLTTPIPNGIMIFSLDDGVFKLGNGVDLFSALPTEFTFAQLVNAQGGASDKFSTPTVEQESEITVISGGLYAASGVTLTSVLASIDALQVSNVAQDAAIAALLADSLKIDASISTGTEGGIIIITAGKFADSGQTLADIEAAANASSNALPGPHLEEPVWYTEAGFTHVADKTQLVDDNTYYCEVMGFHDNTATPVFNLTTNNANVTIGATANNNIFSVVFSGVVAADQASVPVVLYGSIDDGTGNSGITKAMVVILENPFTNILVAVYGGTGSDQLYDTVTDSQDNIFVVGSTNSIGVAGSNDGFVAKFDIELNILFKKTYGSIGLETFNSVAVDSQDNIFCTGYTNFEGAGSNDAIIIKFDNDLNKLAGKVYGGSVVEYFYGVAVDSNDNVFCAGYTSSEGVSAGALLIKFDNLLSLVARKVYDSTGVDFFADVAVDSNDNIICVGRTNSAGAGGYDGLLAKFDNTLNILFQKALGGLETDYLFNVAIDSQDNIICIGTTMSGGPGAYTALIAKFDSSLNILAQKTYGGADNDYFYGIAIDSQDNIICGGYTYSEGAGLSDCVLNKFDSSLNILAQKTYGGSDYELFYGITIDSKDNIICAGYTNSEGPGSSTTLLVKLPGTIPSGVFVGTVLTNLTLADSTLILTDGTLVVTDISFTLADSNMTLADSNMTLADNDLTLESDTLM